MDIKKLFGGLIAIILMGLYVHLVRSAVDVVDCIIATPECTEQTAKDFNDSMADTLATIGGLISALVIAELAITPPGGAPVARIFGSPPSASALPFLKVVMALYVVVWMCTGLWAFVVTLRHPTELQALTDLGKSWFGLAIAAAYAYLGLQPPKEGGSVKANELAP